MSFWQASPSAPGSARTTPKRKHPSRHPRHEHRLPRHPRRPDRAARPAPIASSRWSRKRAHRAPSGRRSSTAKKWNASNAFPAVEKLLYDTNDKNREIAAWWLRRRIFGVFGPGEVYSRTVDTLKTSADATTRARAAEAIGEFWTVPVFRMSPMASSATPSRWSARRRRARSTGSITPGRTVSSPRRSATTTEVRFTALIAATHVHGFSDVASVARLASDASAVVRRHAAWALGQMRARDSVTALIGLTSPDRESDAKTRASAAHALGLIGDASARDALMAAMSDPDSFVRDAARIALRRL